MHVQEAGAIHGRGLVRNGLADATGQAKPTVPVPCRRIATGPDAALHLIVEVAGRSLALRRRQL